MSEQQELEEREVISFPGELLSPLNYIEFGYYSCLPPSPLFSSDLALSLWDFSDCGINGDSNGLPLVDFPQSPHLADEHNSFQESFGNCDKRTWIPPIQGQTSFDDFEPNHMFDIIRQRLTVALGYLKGMIRQDALAQIWLPVKTGSQFVLKTSGQPFVLSPESAGLHQFRMVSLMYTFRIDSMDDKEIGLPSRVFCNKLPEWTPNTQYYSTKEYPQLNHAIQYNIRGSLAIPIFEISGRRCVGVLELSSTSQKLSYAPDIDIICKALEAVDLKSSEILDRPHPHVEDHSRKGSLVEILEILTILTETYKLPLAQTWAPSDHCHAADTTSGGRVMQQVFMSTVDVAFYVGNPHLWSFREACHEHYLLKGQGVVGRSFVTLEPCFCGDITQFRKSEYPLAQYARMFGLNSCFAIPVHDPTRNSIYIVELFLPPQLQDLKSQKDLLASMLATLEQYFQSHKLAFVNEPKEERYLEIIEFLADDKHTFRIESLPTRQTNKSSLGPEALQNGEETEETDSVLQQSALKLASMCTKRKINDSHGKYLDTISNKKRERMSLEDLQQLYGQALNDAAEHLGVSRSTLKRLCRQHGIPRWPSHKIKRNNGEQNIEHENRSVQEAEKALAHTSQSCGLLAGSVDKFTINTQKIVSQQREASVEAPRLVPEPRQYVQHETAVGGNIIENTDTLGGTSTFHPVRAKKRVSELSMTTPPVSYQPQNHVVASFLQLTQVCKLLQCKTRGKSL